MFRKYSNSLGPDALELLEQILDQHEIADADVESSIETLAKEYNKQDGILSNIRLVFTSTDRKSQDALMKVSLEVLMRVYDSLQDQGQRSAAEKEAIDPESHLFFVNAFEMPLWHWSQERGTFEKFVHPSLYLRLLLRSHAGWQHL